MNELNKELEDAVLLYGENHDFVARIYNNIANFHMGKDDFNNALEFYRKAETIYTALYTVDSEMVIDVHYRIGKVMEAKAMVNNEDSTDVKKHFKKTLLMRQYFDSNNRSETEVTELTSAHIDSVDSTLIYNDMAEEARLSGKLDEALPLYVKSIDLRRKKFGLTSSAVCPVLINYAELLKQLTRFEYAKLVLEEALAISIKSYGKKHLAVAECINNLGQVFRLLNMVDKAESLLLEALQLRRELFGDIDELVAATLNNLAELYREKGDYLQAINYHKIAIEAFNKAVGPDHPGTINARGNLGITYRRFSRVNMDEGEVLLRDAVHYMQERDYNPKHPWLLKFGNEHILAQAQRLAEQGKHEQSLELFDTVLHKKRAMDELSSGVDQSTSRPMSPVALGQDLQLIAEGKIIGMIGKTKNLIRKAKHLEAEKMLQEIANKLPPENKSVVIEVMLLRAENQFAMANYDVVAPLYTEALNFRIDMFGPDSVSLVEVMVGLAEYFRSQGEYEQADTFYSQAMKLITFATKNSMQTIGSQDVEHIKLYIITALGSSDLQRNLGCYAAAEQILEPLPSMCTANSFEEDPVFADCFMSLAALEFVKGEYSKAMDLYKEAIDIRTKNYGRTHPKTASTMSHMGNVEFMLCNYESAGRYLDEALNIQLQFFPKNHPAIATSYFRKARLALALDKFAEASQYIGSCHSARKERLGENHPSVAASLSGMAEILAGNFLLKEALDQQSKAITTLRSSYSTTPFHATIIQSSVCLAKTLQTMSRFEDAISVFERCLEMQKAQMESLNVTQHLIFIDLSLLYSDALLAVGRVNEAATIVGNCGVSIFSMFKVERHVKTADCLYYLANVSKAQGRFKDAKYQYSLALAIKNQHMLQYNHRDICRIIAGAADNMRMVGYFHDAFEACSTLETFISSMQCEESVLEVHKILASILHAKILVDRGKAIMAETMFDAATKVVVKIFGEKSVQFLEIKIGLSRCYQQLNKINQAENGLVESVTIAKEVLGMASPITFETISTMHFLKSYLNTKPTEQLKASDALTEEVLPFFAEHSGIAHPYTVHTRGRIGIFMNKAKKDSGRKMIFDALKIFDRYKQLPFTYDHPWIQEMGGFETRANVKERLSHTIEEFAIASWAMPSYEGDRSFGTVPKNIWIDLKNFAGEAWGSVQYYGGDKGADVAVTGAANDAAQPTPFARLRLSKSVTRKVLPTAALTVVAASKLTKTPVVANAPVVDPNVSEAGVVMSGGNEDAILSEMQIRKEVEDQLRIEQEHRKDMEDMLLIENQKLAVTSEMLSKEMSARFLLEQNLMMQNEDLLSTKLVVSDLKHLLDPPPLLEDLFAKDGDIDNSSIDAEVKPEIDLTDEEIIQMITDPKVRAQIDASSFLFDRAMDMHQRGWYRQAQPLLEECFLVRDTHIHRVAVTSETLFLIAKNLSLSFEWDLAQESFRKYLMLKDSNAHTGGAIKYVEAIMAQGINFFRRGIVSDAMEKYSDASKLMLSIPDGALHPCLAEILCNQALGMLYSGKFMEARAMAEKSQAIFGKAFGGGHYACSTAVFIKAEVLKESGSFKMSNVLIEQTLVARRRYLGDSHPLVADCLLSFGICLMNSSRHQESQTKIKLAMAMRQKYFAPVTPPGKREVEKVDLRIVEVIYWQGVLHWMTGNFKECFEWLEKALNLQLLAVDMTEADLDKVFPPVMKSLYGHRSVSSTKKPAVLPTSVKIDKPVMMISDSCLSIAKAYLDIGRFDMADTYMNKALNMRVGINPGEDLNHYKIIECQLALARLNRQRGEYKVELSLVQLLSNDGLRNALGRENPLYFACQLELAEWYRDTGELAQAVSIVEVVVAWRLETFGDEHTDYGEALLVLADCMRRLGKLKRAKEALKQASSVFKMMFGDLVDGHLWLAKCQLCEADIKLNEFENPEAEEAASPREDVVLEDEEAAKRKGDDESQDADDENDKSVTEPEPSTPVEGEEEDGEEGEGEKAKLNDGDGENIEPAKVLPKFNNELYLGMTEAFKIAATMLIKTLLPVGTLLFKAETSFITIEDPSGSSRSSLTLSAHPLLQYTRANMGTISLHEHSKRQEFLDSLPPDVQQEVKAEELMRKRKNREMTIAPGGLEELQGAIQDMLNLPLNRAHHWLQKFLNTERGFTFVLDPMEVATNDYLSAENFRRDGNYFAADEKYDNAFTTQLSHMGPAGAAKSILVADTLLGKADNCRLLGNISLARTLYAQSSWIYRKCQGVDSEGVVKCSFGMGNLLYTLGLYDEANAVFLQVETQWIRFYTENSKEYSQVRTALAFTNWKLGNFEKALSLATASLEVVKGIYRHDMNEFEKEWKKLHDEQQSLKIDNQEASGTKLMQTGQRVESVVVNTYLCLAYIALSMGTFDKFEDYLAGAKRTLEKFQRSLRLMKISQGGDAQAEGLGDEDHFLMADVWHCQVEKMLVMGQAREASKMIMKVMKYRIREFSRTANTEYTSFQVTERRSQFFDSYDALSLLTVAKAQLVLKKSPGKSDDQDVEAEVVNVEEDFGTAENDSEESTLPSAVKYNPIIVPPVFVYKSIPVIPHPATIDCLMLRGKICMELSDFSDAKEMFDASARMMAKLLPHRQSLRKLSINFELANLTFLRGSYDEAKSMNDIILQQRLQLCDEFHPDKAASLFALGRIGLALCKFDDAAQTFAETIKIRKKTFGDQHWLVGEVFMGYAEVLSGKGLYADSNGYFEKALKLFRASFGEMHPLIARAYISHGSNMRDLGSLDFALSLIEQAIAVQCIMFGDDHPSVAFSLYYKASILRSQGKALDTKRVLDLAITIQREKLGKYHPVTVSTLLLIAFNFMDLAKYSTAGQVFERANQLLRKSFGKDHAIVAIGLTGLAECYRYKAMYKKAKDGHETALYMRRKVLGEKHPAVAESLYFLGELQLIGANLDDATRSFDDALALQRMALGNAHPEIALSMQGLGKTQLAQGKLLEAKGTQERVLAMRKSILPAEHPAIGDSQFLIAQIYRKLGKLDQASALFERCASTVRDTRGARHPLVATVVYNAAEVANVLGKFDQARDGFMESLRIRMHVYNDVNEDHPETAESYFGLAENFKSTGVYDFAKPNAGVVGFGKQMPNAETSLFQRPGDDGSVSVGGDPNLTTGKSIADSILDGEDPLDPQKDSPRQTFSEKQNDMKDEASQLTLHFDEGKTLDENSLSNLRTGQATSNNVEIIAQYRAALPLLEKVLAMLQTVETFEPTHPAVLQVRFSMAETYRYLGRFEESAPIFEEVLTQRRKQLGDGHPDTVQAMFGMADALRCMGKLFADNPSGSVEAREIKKAMSSVLSGVTLRDHLASITTSPPPIPGRPETSISGKRAGTAAGGSRKWAFLSQPTDGENQKKKTALKISKGYMGYEFPKDKQLTRTDLPRAAAAVTEKGKGKKVNMGDAKQLYEAGLAAMKVLFGGQLVEHPVVAGLLFSEGELMRARRSHKEALQLLEQALAMRRRLFRGSHPAIADCLNAMAEVFRVENKFSQAAPMFEKALEIRMEAYGGSHPCIAETKNNIAMLHFSQGNYTEAQRLMEDALFTCEELLGPLHPATAVTLNNLAGLLHSLTLYEKALPIYKRALKIKEKAFGADHPDVASTLNNIGLLYKMQGQLDDAQAQYESALEMQKKLYGSVHADVAATMSNLASLYTAQGKFYDAKELYKQAIAMRTTIFGLDHQAVASTYNNYGGLMVLTKEFDTARDLFESALKIKIKVYGEAHPSVAETMNNIAFVLYSQGHLRESLPIFEKALSIKAHAYGMENPTVATAYFTVAGIYHKTGDFEKARERYLEAKEMRFVLFGGRHKDTKLCDEMLDALEKDRLKAAAREGKLRNSLRTQTISNPPLLLSEGSIYEDEKAAPLFESNRT